MPLELTSNFGKVRNNHLHSGLDIRTNKEIGKPVYAVADGYISRILVSPYGFGFALYINHPDNTTSLYGHLDHFTPELTQYVQKKQYRKHTFRIELFPEASEFPVKQGDLIGYSGNSGSSAGPHLHFEIRDQTSQCPLNSLAKNLFKVPDNKPPRLINLYVVEVSEFNGTPVHHVVQKIPASAITPSETLLEATPPFYLAVEVTDTKNSNEFRMGIYQVTSRVDHVKNFELTFDQFDFSTTRYVNTLTLYAENEESPYDLLRLYKSPNNPLPNYTNIQNNGLIDLPDSLPRTVEIDLFDDALNRTTVTFRIKRRAQSFPVSEPTGIPVEWNVPFTTRFGGLTLTIPAGALYESTFLNFDIHPGKTGDYSKQYTVHYPDTPLQKAINLTIKPDSLPVELRTKALLIRTFKDGRRSSAGGGWKEPGVTGSVTDFGIYSVGIDTIPPQITPLFIEGEPIEQDYIALKISDNLAGISRYEGRIDDAWALFEYDPKSGFLSYRFDPKRMELGTEHLLKIEAIDAKGNRSENVYTFWK